MTCCHGNTPEHQWECWRSRTREEDPRWWCTSSRTPPLPPWRAAERQQSVNIKHHLYMYIYIYTFKKVTWLPSPLAVCVCMRASVCACVWVWESAMRFIYVFWAAVHIKRSVNIMKVYIERNNMQVELIRLRQKISTLLTLETLKWEYTFADWRVYEIWLRAIRDESPLFCAGRRMFRDMTTSVHAILDIFNSVHSHFGFAQFGT